MSTSTQSQLFGRPNALVGMVHLRALPGAPYSQHSMRDIIDIAVKEARTLERAGFDALIVENMHDRPYLFDASAPSTVAPFAAAAAAVVGSVRVPVGIQVLSGANLAALAIAHATGASFIRVEGFVFGAVADEGVLSRACAGELLRERKRIGAQEIMVFADLRKKHSSHALTADLDMAAWVRAAEFFGADGMIVTGSETAMEPDAIELAAARGATRLPILVGSGATPSNIAHLLASADAAIVGSSLKVAGCWSNDLDQARIDQVIRARDAVK